MPDHPTVRLAPDTPEVPWDPQEIGEFTLVDQNGDTVTKQDLLGKPWVASFIFTRCAGACPLLVRKVYDLSQAVRDVDVRFVTITVDPEYDTVARMKRYADVYEAHPDKWLFLTGQKDEVYRLIREGFKVSAWEDLSDSRMAGYEFAHSERLVHVDAQGRVLGTYSSSGAGTPELLTLQRVLQGRMETPPRHRPVPPPATSPPPARADEPRRESEPDASSPLPPWAQRLPATNAMLNGLATLLLLVGFTAIKAGHVALHKRMMLTAFGVSIAFLALYLVHKAALHHFTGEYNTRFGGTGSVAAAYYVILASHVLLAMTVPVLASLTIWHGLRDNRVTHRRLAKVTFPIWLYVSVTGVIIYWMLYRLE